MANHPNLVPPAAVVPPPGPAQPPPAPSQHGSVRSLVTSGGHTATWRDPNYTPSRRSSSRPRRRRPRIDSDTDDDDDARARIRSKKLHRIDEAWQRGLAMTLPGATPPVQRPTTPYGTRRAAAAGRWLETPNFIKNFSEAMQINSRNSAATCTDAQAAAFIATFNTPYELYVVANLGYMQLDYLLDCSALDCKYTTSHDTFALHTNQHGLKTVIHHSGDWNKAFERYTNMHKLILHDDGGMITYDELASYSKWFNDIVNSSTIDHRVTFEACYLADQEWRCRAAFEPDLKLTDQAERGPLFLQYVGVTGPVRLHAAALAPLPSQPRQVQPRRLAGLFPGAGAAQPAPPAAGGPRHPRRRAQFFLNTEGLGDSRHYCINFNVDNCSNAHCPRPHVCAVCLATGIQAVHSCASQRDAHHQQRIRPVPPRHDQAAPAGPAFGQAPAAVPVHAQPAPAPARPATANTTATAPTVPPRPILPFR
ncbi:hypothetical protein DFJ73DRAFT_921168 [Zopfochytrium polystomum]|nr:hypothetical protein DFJ73DRAFT_921168 [Zopfochytrium polystomum]